MKTKTQARRWYRYRINHNSGIEYFYVRVVPELVDELVNEHFDRFMPDSAKWRGYQLERVKYVPVSVMAQFRVYQLHASLRANAGHLLAAAIATVRHPSPGCLEKLRQAVKASTTPVDCDFFSEGVRPNGRDQRRPTPDTKPNL